MEKTTKELKTIAGNNALQLKTTHTMYLQCPTDAWRHMEIGDHKCMYTDNSSIGGIWKWNHRLLSVLNGPSFE
jgi:hypothetical protein